MMPFSMHIHLYLARLKVLMPLFSPHQEAGPECHTKRHYLIAINKLQTEDPFDPFLHREWSALLMVEHRYDESEAHLNAAAAILQRDIETHKRAGASMAHLATYARELEACKQQAVQLAAAKVAFARGSFTRKGGVEINREAYSSSSSAGAAAQQRQLMGE